MSKNLGVLFGLFLAASSAMTDAEAKNVSSDIEVARSFDAGPLALSRNSPSFRAYVDTNSEGGAFSGAAMTLIGGNRVDMPHSPWHSDNTAAATQSAAIFGRMDGPYDFGFGLGLFDEPRFYQYQPAAISGEDFRGGNIWSQDAVQLYQNPTNKTANLILSVQSYSANSVTITEQLSDEELLEAHPGAWITTNALADGASSVEDARSNLNTYSGASKVFRRIEKPLSFTVGLYRWVLKGCPVSPI